VPHHVATMEEANRAFVEKMRDRSAAIISLDTHDDEIEDDAK